jgi:cell wall-associated NlpC family hydrolase
MTLWRADLADLALADRLAAQRYAAPEPARCSAATSPLRRLPRADAEQISELLYGERFDVLEVSGGWAWGQCAHDGYVGFVDVAGLTEAGDSPPTHWLSAPSGLHLAGPSLKSALIRPLPMLARLRASEAEGHWLAADGGWCHDRHARVLGDWATDPLSVARQFIGSPYLWGGRSRAGIDCSGLVQISLMACGLSCPRDSDMQRALGVAVPVDAPPLAGDLVFFKGHVGWMLDSITLLHANAYWMAVVAEPLADVVARLQTTTDRPIEAVRRLSVVN